MKWFALLLLSIAPATASAAVKPDTAAVTERIVKELQAFQSTEEWLQKAPGLSRIERDALHEIPNLAKQPLPKISFRAEKNGQIWVKINEDEFDFTHVAEGKLGYKGKTISVEPGMSALGFSDKLARATKRKTAFTDWLLPSAQAAPGAINRGCATKDFFTIYDIFESPFGFIPHIWISSATIAVMRWTGNQFRSCERHVNDLRDLLRKGGIAVKQLSCGKDNWGADVEIDFWLPSESSDRSGTVKYYLDYTNSFAREETPALKEYEEGKSKIAPDQRLYVFRPEVLQEVRVLRDKGEDFREGCERLNDKSVGAAAEAFRQEKTKMEKFRKVFYYLGRYNTCTACPRVETQVTSARPPSYIRPLAVDTAEPIKGGQQTAE